MINWCPCVYIQYWPKLGKNLEQETKVFPILKVSFSSLFSDAVEHSMKSEYFIVKWNLFIMYIHMVARELAWLLGLCKVQLSYVDLSHACR